MRRVLPFLLLAAAIVGFEAALFKLAQTGTCASGGPYVIANECPSGLGWWVALLIVSALALLPATLLLPYGPASDDGKDEDRPWLPVFAFFPGTRECAAFSVLSGAVILAAGTDSVNVVVAAVLIVGMPLLWLGAKWLIADTDRVLRERRRAAQRMRRGKA